MRPVLALALAISLTTACHHTAIGPSASSPAHPPPAHGPLLATWEHYCVYPQNEFDIVLAEASAAGWEMVSAANDSGLLLCFKRPLTQAPTPTPAVSPAAAGS